MGDPYRHETRRLSSGAQLFHLERDLPWTGAVFMIAAGHMHDPLGKEGTAHLLEHYLSSGSIGELSAMPQSRLQDWIGDQGMMANLGITSTYWTRYGGRALNGNARLLFQFLSDLVFRPGFDGDLEHDRAIVRAERKDRVSVLDDDIGRTMRSILYGDHRRATMTGLPKNEVLDGIVRKDVIGFHRRYYGAPNLRVITIGGLSLDDVSSALEHALPLREHASFEAVGLIPQLPLKSFSESERTFKVTSGRSPAKAELSWIWHLPSGNFGVRSVTRSGLRSILIERVRERLRAAYHVTVDSSTRGDHASFEISTTVAHERIADVRAEVEATLLDTDAIRARIPRIRSATERQTLFMDERFGAILEDAAMSVSLCGRVETMEEALSEIQSVSDEAVLRFVRSDLDINQSFLQIVVS